MFILIGKRSSGFSLVQCETRLEVGPHEVHLSDYTKIILLLESENEHAEKSTYYVSYDLGSVRACGGQIILIYLPVYSDF